MKMEKSGGRQEDQVLWSRREVIPGLGEEKRAGKAGHLKEETGLKLLLAKKRRKGVGREQAAGRKGGRAGLLREETGQKLEQIEGNGQTKVMVNPTGEITDMVLRQNKRP